MRATRTLIAVWIAGAGEVSAGWAAWAGLLGSLYLVAHLVVRRTAPFADPVLLPLTGLLTAVGLTVIYRLEQVNTNASASVDAISHSSPGTSFQIRCPPPHAVATRRAGRQVRSPQIAIALLCCSSQTPVYRV